MVSYFCIVVYLQNEKNCVGMRKEVRGNDKGWIGSYERKHVGGWYAVEWKLIGYITGGAAGIERFVYGERSPGAVDCCNQHFPYVMIQD